MLTIKLPYISDNNDLLNDYIYNYTGLFYKLYNNAELMADKTFIKQSLNQYIDRSIYEFCVAEVKIKLNQYDTDIKNKQKEINELTVKINTTVFKTTKEKINKYKIIQKINYLNSSLYKNICFGSKYNLRKITKLNNDIKNIQKFDNTNISLLETKNILLNKYKNQFKESRILGIYLIGNSFDYGNRKMKFDFYNKCLVFKPNRNVKINIDIKPKKNIQKTLEKIQDLINSKSIPITIKIDKQFIHIMYDEELLNDYKFNEKSCKKEQSLHITKEAKKDVYIKFKREQDEHKLENKINNRYLAVDLNPQYIGLSIVDKIDDKGTFDIILKECIDMSKLSTKLKLSSFNDKQRKQNNKRKHEIKEVWKYIFNLVKHYKVGYFVIEDLNFKSKDSNSSEFNRKTKNIWHRTLTEQLINKYCNINGVIKIEVNPCYSSFIGNMIYDDYDPISASLELNRRGIVKYIKGSSIYPDINRINQEKLNYLLGENILVLDKTWIELYRILTLLRYRNLSKDKLLDRSLFSVKSNVSILY